MKKILLYQHGGSGNHGCEALATTISAEIKRIYDESYVMLSSNRAYEDHINTVDEVVQKEALKKWSIPYIFHQIDRRFFNCSFLQDIFLANKFFKKLPEDVDGVIAIGGDNYCYSKGKIFWANDRAVKKNNKKLMLWGASIEPDEIPGELANHLKIFDLIVARESITYNALMENGFEGKAFLAPDPAFLLETEELPLPENWKEGQMVGINLSPLILNYSQDKEAVISSIYALVQHIIDSTDMNIALIPHVRHSTTDDVSVLKPIYEKFKDTDRIVLIDDKNLSCKQLKGYISRCRFFMGARTHSIVAAYSSGVPAIAFGYSVKAKGIARDLFGTEENLVLPVQTFDEPKLSVDAFDYMMEHEEELKGIYEEKLPEYKQRAQQTICFLRNLLDD
ncbi:MAG: polysaccharide pyruvyl transferase family protein [Clostridia bacterium]|nr:polysaccharide pyruvyl transferase family protein [Clostridia bacterium]